MPGPPGGATARPALTLAFHRRPSALRYMLGAFGRRPGLGRSDGFPALQASWAGHRVDLRHLAAFLDLTGLPGGESLPFLYPHVLGFRLLMAVLTHRSFPLPIWAALQTRNHILEHRPLPAGATLDLETRVDGQRLLPRGAEVDLRTTVSAGGGVAWESLVTFYYRGRHGEPAAPSPLARAPEVDGGEVAAWRVPAGGGLRFARLNGDYNPLHYAPGYARRLGFGGAFHHPPLVLGQCLSHLPALAGGPRRLDAWLKGPVPYGCEVRLRTFPGPGGPSFALVPAAAGAGEAGARPALIGRWREAEPGERP